MILLITYTLGTFGLAYIVGHSVISFPIRQWLGSFESRIIHYLLELIECPACFGFWIGFFSGLLSFGSFLWAVGLGTYTCATNLLLGKLVGLME